MNQIQLLQFETDTACTGNCTFCTHNSMTPRKRMPLPQIIDLTYNLAHHANTICPFGWQEPLLDNRVDKILSNVRLFNPKANLTIYTTFPVYPKRQLENIAKWGLADEFIVSCYGGTKQLHNTLQPGADYDRVVANVKRFMKLKQRINHYIPKLSLGYMVTKETYPHIKRFMKAWKGKVDEIKFFRYYSWTDKQPYDSSWEEKVWGPPAPRVPCQELYTNMNVHSNGNIVSCCLDYNEENIVGNVFTGWDSWWTSPKLQQLRTLHEEGRWNENPLCAKCTKWRYNHTKEWIEYWRTNKTLSVASAVNR